MSLRVHFGMVLASLEQNEDDCCPKMYFVHLVHEIIGSLNHG